MLLSPLPVIDPAIWRLRPDFVALSITVSGGRNGPSDNRSAAMRAQAFDDRASAPAWAAEHLDAWREAYRAFGAKPQRTPCSAEALRRRRARDGMLPAVNWLVDAYNALSVRFAVPIGGENLAAYRGRPHLTRAVGDEAFEVPRDGVSTVEHPDPGEVVWRDDAGITCRRWNWRQSPRTRLEVGSSEMWFVVERLEPMPLAALDEVGAALAHAVRTLAPDAVIETALLRTPGQD
jgi:DNA/RNA-binding domain of Phe-tRNA-synthetase-like protein